jgi:hypothetical protein
VTLPPMNEEVKNTEPPPAGSSQRRLADYFESKPADADKWGRLYGLARADALMCRQAIGASP